MIGLGLGLDRGGFVPSLDADFKSVLSQGTSLGYSLPTGTALTAGEQLVKDLKAAGIWSKLDLFYVFATNGDSDFATLNWKTPASFQATKVSSPTFTSLEGFTGDGVAAYIDTNWEPSTDSVNYTLNDASFGGYQRTLSGSDFWLLTADNRMRLRGATSSIYNINSTSNLSAVITPTEGLAHLDRQSNTNVTYYDNSIANARTQTSSSLAASPLRVLGNGSSVFSSNQVSVVFAGASLASEASDFYNAIQTYMTAIGTQV